MLRKMFGIGQKCDTGEKDKHIYIVGLVDQLKIANKTGSLSSPVNEAKKIKNPKQIVFLFYPSFFPCKTIKFSCHKILQSLVEWNMYIFGLN